MLISIEKMFKTLDNHGIRYCHWKSNEHLEEALNGDTDLDVLFDPAQRSDIEKVMNICGLKRFRNTPLMQYNAIEDYIGFDQFTAKIWHLHTHYRMTLGEKHLKGYTITPWGSILINNRIKRDDIIWTTASSDEFVLLLCRIALKIRWRDLFQELGKDDRKEIAWLKPQLTKEAVALSASNLLGEKSKEIVLALYGANIRRKSQFLILQKVLRKELKPYTLYNKFTSWFTRTKREVFWLFGGLKRKLGLSNYYPYRRVSPSGGIVVAILGCDGAGKSTTLSYMRKEFNKKIDVVSIYFGSGDGSSSLIRKPMKVIAKKVGGKGIGTAIEKEYSEERKISLKSRLYSVSKIIWAIALAKEKKAKQRLMIKARNRGMLVLTDRYPQNEMPGASDGPLLNRYLNGKGILKKIAEWEQKIYKSFSINNPDLAIKLVVHTDIAISRKPEMTIEEIENKKRIVMNMNISEHVAIIDTSKSFEITRGEGMKAIWDLI